MAMTATLDETGLEKAPAGLKSARVQVLAGANEICLTCFRARRAYFRARRAYFRARRVPPALLAEGFQ